MLDEWADVYVHFYYILIFAHLEHLYLNSNFCTGNFPSVGQKKDQLWIFISLFIFYITDL